MKTLPEIVQEHINQKSALAYDTEGIMREAKAAEQRMMLRMKSDPSLDIFVSHYAHGMMHALKILPPNMEHIFLRQMLAQIITEWEDCNISFNQALQLK